ncbi:MAG TPA: hypothetical protein VM074_08170 [Solimonas sp.]|nr:hypothetical protein [Solimonas sp.]
MAALAMLLAACGLSTAPAGSQHAPVASTPVIRTVVALPDGVAGVRSESCTWSRDAGSLLCPFQLSDGSVQVGMMDPDGTDFRCLTCGTVLDGTPGYLYAFADGRRFFYATLPEGTENASAGTNIAPHIAECAPSLLQCDRLTLSDVTLPSIAGDLNDREPRLSPDGRHYVWTVVRADGFLMLMGDLNATASGYEVSNVRVLNPAPNPRSAAEWAIRGSFSEAKSFNRGGQLLFASTRDSGRNLDVYSLDIGTGAIERITHNLEWEEDAQFDPTRRFLIIGSARRMHNQLRASSLVDASPFLDAAIIAATAPASLATHTMRLHTLEKWLTTVDEERAGGDGLMLNLKDGGWASGAAKSPWSPDGTQAAWGERGPDGATRLLHVRFPLFARQLPVCADPESQPDCQTPTPSWAPPVAQYLPLAAGTYSIPGPRGGSALLSFGGTIVGPYNSVRYSAYKDEQGRVFDGSATLNGISRGGLSMTISADVTVSGASQGRSTAEISAKGTLVCGTVDSTLDGKHLHSNVGQWNPDCGFQTPEMCPDGADVDATETGDCSQDGLPNRYAAPAWGG